MRMFTFGFALTAAALFACCATAAAPAPSWKLEPVPDGTPVGGSTGCQSSYSAKGANPYVWVDDNSGVANIKIGGKIYVLHSVSQKASGAGAGNVGAHADSVYKDKSGAVVATLSTTVTEVGQEDTFAQTGTLTVTFKGTTQKIAIEGGYAC